ncbi:hypothetical protein CHARACLAT_020920 [Characodon lateralis]|uniref:Uncharacterized protein n=1 Tax=Characodon lateralis TaxID=208331 RepID=A0ABU7F4P8_9TELE|nr:hypothetical protein [Characodon lateralis]
MFFQSSQTGNGDRERDGEDMQQMSLGPGLEPGTAAFRTEASGNPYTTSTAPSQTILFQVSLDPKFEIFRPETRMDGDGWMSLYGCCVTETLFSVSFYLDVFPLQPSRTRCLS